MAEENEKPKTREEKNALEMQELISRMTCFSGWYLVNQHIGLGLDTMLRELYVQTAFNHAGLMALSQILSKGRRVKNIDLSELSTKLLRERLADMEKQYLIRITPAECFSVDEKGNRIEETEEKKVQ
jgi:hypothetical protein